MIIIIVVLIGVFMHLASASSDNFELSTYLYTLSTLLSVLQSSTNITS